MLRDGRGKLSAWVQAEQGEEFSSMGELEDERVSRLVWLGYLGGKTVASEGARANIVDGIMEIVERPIGTVETQVL